MASSITNPAAAASAYANTAKTMNIGGAQEAGDDKASFGAILKNSIAEGLSVMKNSETMSAKAITGEASLPDVVQAVNAADLTLQTIVAVRDRLINAYTELMRMPI